MGREGSRGSIDAGLGCEDVIVVVLFVDVGTDCAMSLFEARSAFKALRTAFQGGLMFIGAKMSSSS